MSRSPIIAFGCTATAVAFLVNPAPGDIIHTTPDQFAVLARGRISAERGVSITGLLGAGGSLSMDRDSFLSSGLFAGGALSFGRGSRVDGSVLVNGSAAFNRDATVFGPTDVGDAISLGRNGRFGAVTAGGDAALRENVTTHGDLRASGDVSIRRDSTILGDVVHGGSISLGRNVTITGDVSQGLAQPNTWAGTFRDVPTLGTSSGAEISHGHGSDVALAPGDYGRLRIERDSTLRLSAGEYNFESGSFGRDVRILLDNSAGDIMLNFVHEAAFGRGDVIDLLGDTGGGLLFQSGGDARFGRDSVIEGDFRVFGGELTLDDNVTLTGTLYGQGRISLGERVSVAVPSPAGTSVLAMVGLLSMARRRRGD